MLNINQLRAIEERGLVTSSNLARSTIMRVAWLFFIVVLGILSSWFWDIGWQYLTDPGQGLPTGPWQAVLVRIILSFIIAATTFANMYSKINQNTQESWIPYFLAFQNGFFWDALFQSVAQTVNSGN